MDSSSRHSDDAMNALGQRLRGWQPASAGLDRDRLLYDAGRAAAQAERTLGRWHLSTAALTLLALGLGMAWVRERGANHALGKALAQAEAARKSGAPWERAIPAGGSAPMLVTSGPVDPSSYLALTLGLTGVEAPQDGGVESIERTHVPALGVPPLIRYRVRGVDGTIDL